MHPMRRTERGFTLIEAVMVIAITGVVVAVVSVFIVPATSAYFASAARAQLGDHADTALRRIARDLARALPNSARVSASGQSLELIPVSGAARYATGTGDVLEFGVVDTTGSFAVVGPPLRLSRAGQQLAWFNLGAGMPDADAYTQANVRVSSSPAGDASSVGIAGAAPLASTLMSPPYRVYAIEPPVSYRCDPAARTLTRHVGYGLAAAQPDPPAGGTSAVLARDVQSCRFSYDPAALTARYALVSLQLTLARNGEAVSLHQAVHVDNLP